MSNMFSGCKSLIDLDLSNFDTKKVTNMENMFLDCISLKNLDLLNFNTSNVVIMCRMFYNCKSLIDLDLSRFDTSKVFNMYQGKTERVSFKVANRLADVIVDEFGKTMMIPIDKEHFMFSANIQISPPFFAWLFTFGPDIAILEPSTVKDEMLARAKEIEELYK